MIKKNTDTNYHAENLSFIAKKIDSPLKKELKKINQQHLKEGSLSENLWNKRYKVSQKLLKELKRKNPKQFDAVYGGL